MCGIFGIVTNSKSNLSFYQIKSISDTLFRISESRGKEAAGISIYNKEKGSIDIFKCSIKASDMVKEESYKNFYNNAMDKLFSKNLLVSPIAFIGHSRLVTNGNENSNNNNQPVTKNGLVAVHNGIITNVDVLYNEYNFFKREYEVDTEILLDLIDYHSKELYISDLFANIYNEIEGAASLAVLSNKNNKLFLTTNTGSLYYVYDKHEKYFIFASERFILQSFFNKNRFLKPSSINWLGPCNGLSIEIDNLIIRDFDFNGFDNYNEPFFNIDNYFSIHDRSNIFNNNIVNINLNHDKANIKLLQHNIEQINNLKRCSKCVLPETFPFIEFDDKGVCNYCNNYKKLNFKGQDALFKDIERYRKVNNPDCIVTFSGGRDSSYGLHYIKNILKLNPIAYSYDWGMITDLARRNQARLCGKLGIEHILISADIRKKLKNIRKNVIAWLKRPNLGTVPLFMAGDKQYFYYANKLSKLNNINLIVLCENMLETTNFKTGFCGIQQSPDKEHTYTLTLYDKIKLISFYTKEYLLNPSYINNSLIDTATAFLSYYFIPHDYLNIYNYIKWDEEEIESTLINEYNWEKSTDTETTWRIGDGTAAFYNYIYYTVAGFSENDTFRSNQIREGMITRDEALTYLNEENKPRYESIKWYCNRIGIDFHNTIKTINNIIKLY